MQGFVELLKAGLVGWTQKDGQAVLNDEGIDYIKNMKKYEHMMIFIGFDKISREN